MRKTISIALFLVSMNSSLNAQNFYYRLDVGTNNIYSFVVANLATAGLNTLANDMLFDNAYTYTYLQDADNAQGVDVNGYNVMGITAREIFSDITTGLKLGYQSSTSGVFNWGLYASAHYRLNQFKTVPNAESLIRHNVQRALFGIGMLLTFGSIERSTKFIIEAAVRYEIPLSYSGIGDLETKDMLNNGISGHFAFKINGSGALQGLGIYADIPFYKLFKDDGVGLVGTNIKPYSFGLIYTITPWNVKSSY